MIIDLCRKFSDGLAKVNFVLGTRCVIILTIFDYKYYNAKQSLNNKPISTRRISEPINAHIASQLEISREWNTCVITTNVESNIFEII